MEKETDIPKQEPRNMQTHEIYISVEEMTGKIYTDQVVQFQVKYSGGSSYDMLIYDYESNEILTQAIKNKQNKQWQKIQGTAWNISKPGITSIYTNIG